MICLPVVVAEGHDVVIYAELQNALDRLEAVDVDDGVYSAWDSKGQVLRLETDPPQGQGVDRSIRISTLSPPRYEPERLRSLLSTVLREHAQVQTRESGLADTIDQYVAWAGISR